MRLVILTQYYPPEIGAPQNRLSDLARRLVRMGYSVSVLTAMPNYPIGVIHPGYRRKIYLRENVDGVDIQRSWIYATRSRRVLPRLLNYFSFAISSALIGLWRLPQADFLFTESPPLFLGISGFLLAKFKRAHFVLNVADLWPKAAVDLGVVTNHWLISLAERLEEFLYRKAALVTTQTEGFVQDIKRRLPQVDVRLLTNGGDLEQYGLEKTASALPAEWGMSGYFIVGYAGLHGPAQALDKVIEAASYLRDFPGILLTFFGEGPTKVDLQRTIQEQNVKNVRLFPLQPREGMPNLIASWDVGLVPLYDSDLMRSTLPSKMFEIMATGVPVLLSAPLGEASSIIQAAQGGLCVKPENPTALAEAILRLYRDRALKLQLGRNARVYVGQHYNRETIAKQFSAYLTSLTGAIPQEK